MRVAHVVNLLDEVGSYGGPLRVAINQARALTVLGHEVTLVAGATGLARRAPERVTGDLPTRPARSWNVLGGPGFALRWAPGLHAWLLRNARSYDVVHVHLGRDLTTAPSTAVLRALRVPYVVQTHGMVDASGRRLARVLDALLVRAALERAHRVLVLTERERHDVLGVAGRRRPRIEELHNGVSPVPTSPSAPVPAASGPATGHPEVLFMSRLQARKRPLLFVRAALALRASGVDARFTVVGPDEGELAAVQDELGRADDPDGRVTYGGVAPMGGSLERLAAADVLVLPSVDEPFPMVVAEAMSVGVPVVCTESCGLAPWVRDGAGLVVPDDDVEALSVAVRRLVEDPDLRRACGAGGRAHVAGPLSIEAVARNLERLYAEACRTRAARPAPGA